MIPVNEFGVVVEFASKCVAAGWTFKSIQASFPDALIQYDGVEYRVEFEFEASNFVHHGHDPRQCDLIICWSRGSYTGRVPVLVLEDEEWTSAIPQLPQMVELECEYWRLRANALEYQLSSTARLVQELESRIATEIGVEASTLRRSGLWSCANCGAEFTVQQSFAAHRKHCALAKAERAAPYQDPVEEVV